MEPIYTISKLYKALVLARPSKVCKSPYLADVKVFDEEGNVIEENVMAHSPALGCCGLISKDAYVMCAKSESVKAKSKYVIHHIVQKSKDSKTECNSIIGVNPMLANPIVKALLLNNKIAMFQNITELKPEVTVEESRFDYTFKNSEGKKVYLEVKNVPLVDEKDKSIAIFPDGYRKNKAEPVSPRALKHVNHLSKIHKENPDVLCALVFLIQRTDVVSFKPSSLDPIYHKAVYDAVEDGVLVLPYCVSWEGNECKFLKTVELLPK